MSSLEITRVARIADYSSYKHPEYYMGWDVSNGVVSLHIAGQDAVDRAKALLAGVEGGVEKALRGAMARSVSHLRTNSAKAIRERYAISAANIRANENIKVSYNYQDGVQAYVYFSGNLIPLYRFDGSAPKVPTPDTSKWVQVMINEKLRWVHPGIAAVGRVLKGSSPFRFDNAFVARMPNTGHIGIYERKEGESMYKRTRNRDAEDIEELFGPSIPQMLGSEEVEEKLTKETMQKFEERLDHEITAILNGWR